MTVHFLQDTIKHQAATARGPRVNRPQATRRNHTYNPTPCAMGRGAKKYGKKFSKVIGNPQMLRAGADIIWNQV